MIKKLFIFCFFLSVPLYAQRPPASFLLQDKFRWPNKFTNYKEIPDSLKEYDVVILKEGVGISDGNIHHTVVIKILNQSGLHAFKEIQLPEDFDLSNSSNLNKMGRFAGRKTPFVYDFMPYYFAARIIRPKNRIIELPLKYTVTQTYWLKSDGERLDQNIYKMQLSDLQIGDILEYTYSSYADWCTMQDIIYPNGTYPKFNYDLYVDVEGKINSKLGDLRLLYNANIDSLYIKTVTKRNQQYKYESCSYHFDYLRGVNYPENLCVGKILPNVSINHRQCSNDLMRLVRLSKGYYSFATIYQPSYDYRWAAFVDTVVKEIYTGYHAHIRRFLNQFEEDKDDTAGIFFGKQLTKAMNKLKFLSAENMYYSGEAKYAVWSSERLLNGKIAEEFLLKNYEDLWTERKKFFYEGIVLDKRRSEINPYCRNHSLLEQTVIVVPRGNEYWYFMPRYKGIKYFPNELPFYLEGANCALIPCNNCVGNNMKRHIVTTTTPSSSFIENVRSEVDTFKINPDSMLVNADLTEGLKGQFSTILRHYYNKEAIDSTMSESYFRKCTDKPLSNNVMIKQISSEDFFPFKQMYRATEKIKMERRDRISLKNWFSFLWKKEDFGKLPNYDFYIDFPYIDAYSFVLDFNKPVEIINTESFTKNLANEYFEVEANITKQDQNRYLVKVIVKVKKNILPVKEGVKLIEFVKALTEINDFDLVINK